MGQDRRVKLNPGGLKDKHSIEADFHDRKAKYWKELVWYRMECLKLVHKYATSLLGDINGKIVIDFGTRRGDNALYFAELGAQVYAFDISKEMINIASRRKIEKRINNLHIEEMAAENLRYPSNFADYIFGGAVLHHTMLSHTRREVHRVIKPGGQAVFIEPLNHNPLIKLFRMLLPSYRSSTEMPLRF